MTVTIALRWPERLRLFLSQWFPSTNSSTQAPAQTRAVTDGGETHRRYMAQIMADPRKRTLFQDRMRLKEAWLDLVEKRMESGITSEQIAKQMKVKKSVVEDFEEDPYDATVDTWSRYAEALDFTLKLGVERIEDEVARAEAA